MALVTHQVQGSYAIFPSRTVSLNKGLTFKQFGTTLRWAVKTETFPSLRWDKSSLSVGAPLVIAPNTKFLRIAAFKGKNDESGDRTNGSTSAKKSAKFSYVQQENENTFTGSVAIQNLFKNWLTLLRSSPPSNEAVDKTLESSDPAKLQMMPDLVLEDNRGNILLEIWGLFWNLDAAVKVPLLLFTPLYLTVNVAYGVQVSKELTPLWIYGPLILALYVKTFKGICALYTFTFNQTVKLFSISPTTFTYIADGKLKEEISVRFWQPLLDVKNRDFKEFVKELRVWAVDKYLDCLELIWPTYCRTIRFLKRANLI